MYHEILPPSTHAQKEITCSKASLHPSEQFYMHKNTSASVLIVWELIELTEYCHLLTKGSESALEVCRCTTKLSHLPHMRRRRSPVPRQVLHPSEQFYMHKTTSGSVLIVWELIELTEYCHLLKKGSESALESAQIVPRNSPTFHTCGEGDHLFQGKFYIPEKQFYMHKKTSASVLIVWELIELTEYCHLLKKGSERALEVRRCTTKFSHLPHMRRRRSPVPRQVYISVNSSICIRRLPQVYSSFES